MLRPVKISGFTPVGRISRSLAAVLGVAPPVSQFDVTDAGPV